MSVSFYKKKKALKENEKLKSIIKYAGSHLFLEAERKAAQTRYKAMKIYEQKQEERQIKKDIEETISAREYMQQLLFKRLNS